MSRRPLQEPPARRQGGIPLELSRKEKVGRLPCAQEAVRLARCCEVGMVDGSSSVRTGGGPPEWETGEEGPATPVGVAASCRRRGIPALPHFTAHPTRQTQLQNNPKPTGAPSPQHRSLGSAWSELVGARGPHSGERRGFPAPVSPRGRGKYHWTVWRGAGLWKKVLTNIL